ncbi:hypothetical protein V3W47_14665 [Deinococcus sp. YIM 134068]
MLREVVAWLAALADVKVQDLGRHLTERDHALLVALPDEPDVPIGAPHVVQRQARHLHQSQPGVEQVDRDGGLPVAAGALAGHVEHPPVLLAAQRHHEPLGSPDALQPGSETAVEEFVFDRPAEDLLEGTGVSVHPSFGKAPRFEVFHEAAQVRHSDCLSLQGVALPFQVGTQGPGGGVVSQGDALRLRRLRCRVCRCQSSEFVEVHNCSSQRHPGLVCD